VVPRIVDCPCADAFPPARHQGSIYENQTSLQSRYFEQESMAAGRQPA
jgi:hypothetical protein